jgi:hypothetical protein
MKWLHKMANKENSRLTSLFDFTHTSCFFALHDPLFPGYENAWDPRRCTGPSRQSWQRAAVAVEFHAYSRRRYWEALVPRLPELRRRYAEANGTLLTVATFREPESHLVSVYKMWPPSRRCKCGGQSVSKHAVPLPEWLPRAVGLQAGSLTLDSWPHARKGFHNLRGCEVLQQGRERLQTFDAIGVMDCMPALLSSLCAALRWPCDADRERMDLALRQSLKFKPHGVSKKGVMMREASAWNRLEDMNATTREGVSRAARCDKVIYDDAIRRLGLTPPRRLGERLNSSLCAAASFVRRAGAS